MRKLHYPLVILWFLPALVAPAGAQRTGGEIAALMQRMTTAQKAAQLIMPWISGNYTAFDDPVFERIQVLTDSLQIGGVVISIGPPTEIAARLNHLQRRARIPLLVASDFEGGTAFRVIGGTAFPTNMGVGAGGREADAYQMGRIMAEEARALGVHLTFSPVADVNNNPANPIINTRSFGSDPRQVARLVEAQIRGSQEHGLLATAKHFPGHGDTQTDSHLALPVIEAGWHRLETLELVPFRAAIRAGVAAVMSAHVTLPGIDSGRRRPATMVPEILTGILRDSLGFRGLIVTDALDMGGVVRSYDAGEAAVSALLAGSDILLMPTDPVAAVNAVVAAVEAGRITPARLDSSVRRILTLKARLGLVQRRTVNLDSVGYLIGRRASIALAGASTRRSLVLLRDRGGFFDSVSVGPRSIALVAYTDVGSGPGVVLASELRIRGHRVTLTRLTPQSGSASYDSARAAADTADLVLYAVSVRPREGAGRIDLPPPLADLISGTRSSSLLVSFGSPYIIAQVPQVSGYLVAWVSTPISERAVVNALYGAPVTGRLPVAIPPLFQLNAGVMHGGGQATGRAGGQVPNR